MKMIWIGLLVALCSPREKARAMNINNLVNHEVARADTVAVDPAVEAQVQKRKAELKVLARQQNIELAAQNKLQIPKVALLFLTRGEMPHEAAWVAWLAAARHLVPLEHLPPGVCSTNQSLGQPGSNTVHKLPSRLRRQVLAQQALFSIYVHPAPDFKGYSVDSLFSGRSLRLRVKVSWGLHSEVEAMRLLLHTALKNPLNQHFVFLCEKSVPLYSPAVVYSQLLKEGKSRIDACPKPDPENQIHSLDRWSEAMLPVIPRSMWRKSGQWLSLTRRHAAVTVADHAVASEFEEHCEAEANEHYFGVVLAVAGLDNETTCSSNVMSVQWPWQTGDLTHPVTFQADQIDLDLFLRRRQSAEEMPADPPCQDQAAIKSAESGFIQVGPDWRVACRQQPAPAYNASLLVGRHCTLFARKMSAFATAQVVDTVTSCDPRLKIAPRENCTQERRRRYEQLWW